MLTIIQERVYLPDRTLSSWYKEARIISKILELPWLNNKRAISCILEGTYLVTKEPPILPNDTKGRRERPYWHFRVHNVPGRSGILVHPGQDVRHSKGCLLTGSRFGNYDTSQPTVEESAKKLKWLIENLPDKFMLEIRKKP